MEQVQQVIERELKQLLQVHAAELEAPERALALLVRVVSLHKKVELTKQFFDANSVCMIIRPREGQQAHSSAP